MLAAVVGFHHPSLFLWFNNTYVTWSLVFCMAAMGLTLTFEEITNVFTRSPQLLLLGERVLGVSSTTLSTVSCDAAATCVCWHVALFPAGMVLQYTVLPSIGWAISRFWGLQASLAIGVALVRAD